MNAVTSEDISALLDGELSPERAAQVRAAIAAEPMLRADHEALMRLDAGLSDLAAAAAFRPDIALPQGGRASVPQWAALAALLVALLLVRLAPKLLDMALAGITLQAVAAGAVLIAVIRMARGPMSVAYRPA